MRLRPSRTLLAALFLISASLASLQAQTVPPPMAPNWGRGGPFQPRATATAVPRIMVKFRPALGDAVEAALPTHPMSLSAGGTMPAQVAAFMAKYSARTLAPLYPDLVEAKKQRQVSALQLASEVRARYAKRASRLRAEFAPQDLSRTYVMETGAPPEAFAKILTAMKADPDLEYAEADKIVSVQLMPNDPYFSSYGSWGQAYYDLWGLHTINAASAWDTSTGAGIVVAVVDTGIDSTHPDIAANVVPGWDFIGSTYTNPQQDNNTMDVLGHGTHVAGTIAAIGNNDIGIIGVAWQAHVMPVKALDDTGSGLDSTLAPAIEYAANNGADVINASWGGEGSDQTIADAVNYAYNMGMVFVAAAGNSDADANYFYPAGLWDVITVAASDPTDAIASFSNWGSKIDVAAPGVGILSLRAAGSTLGTIVGNDYMVLDGTSMAAPHVSGLAALLLAKYPQYSNEDVRQAIRVSADNIGQPGFDMNFGYGRIDASAAVAVSGALEARINSPAEGTTAQRAVTISGVAQGSGFASYKLEYGLVPGPGLQPTTWTTLQTGTSPVSGTLGLFDATAVPDGAYIIRLTVYNTAGQGFVDEVQVTAAAVTITSPVPAQVPPAATTFKPGVTIPISGSTIASGFQSFQVAWARGSNPSSGWQTTGITLVQGGSVSVTGGPIATWDTSSITQADYYTIQLTVTASNFTNTTSTMVYFEPDLLSVNWPQWLGLTNEQSGIVPAADSAGNIRLAVSSRLFNGPPWAGSWSFSPDGSSQTTVNLNWGGYTEPAAGSLDGNPGEEVLVTDDVVLDVFSPIGTSPLTAFSSTDFDFAFDQMVLDDLAGDGQLETVALGNHYNPNTGNDGTAAVFAWRNNGQQLNANFPIPVADQNFLLYTSITSNRVLVGDIDGDGNQEIVVMAGTTATTYTPLLFGSDGLPRQWNAPSFNGKPNMMALADLDHNGKLELIFNNYGDGTLHVLQPDGSERPGWPQTVWGDSFAIGDLNQDGRYEIATWCNGNLCVFNTDGTSFSAAFPWAPPAGVSYAPVVLADINGDGYPEIITTYEVYQYTQESSSSLDAAARNSIPANAGPRIKTARQIGPDGRVAVRSVKTSAAAQSN
ncbi:MAG: S8 family serine peptidase, partial [Bryobacteraceae bacterium]